MDIDSIFQRKWLPLGATFLVAICAVGVLAESASAAEFRLTLTGEQEVPPVKTPGNGAGVIVIGEDGSISGNVKTNGIAGTAAHIHVGAAGANGPIAIALAKDGDLYLVPFGLKLTEAQFARYRTGELYVNVHTAANPGGEMRAQLYP